MLGLKRHQTVFLMPEFRHEQKRNMFLALLPELNISEPRREKVVKLVEWISTKSRLRNHIAHSVWTRGRKKDTIKPLSVTVKQKLEVLGIDHNEKEWTAKELEIEAVEISQLHDELKTFLMEGGDLLP
jgi:hypothetical protein